MYQFRERDEYTAEFLKFDQDKSGFIDVKELSEALSFIKTFKGDFWGSFSPSTTFAKEVMAEFGLLDIEGWQRVMFYLEHVLKHYKPDGASETFDAFLQQHLQSDPEFDFLTSGRNPEYIEAFRRYDVDRSGRIDRHELHRALVYVKQSKDSPFSTVSEATAKMLLGIFGTLNHGGWQRCLHYIEAATQSYVPDRDGPLMQFVVQGLQKRAARKVYRIYDPGQMIDGEPSPKRQRREENPEYRAAFSKFDKDGNGWIDPHELENALTEVKRTKDILHGGSFDLHCRRMLMGVFGVLNRQGWTAMLIFIEDANKNFVAGFDNFEVHIQNAFGGAPIDQAKFCAKLSDAYSQQFTAFDKDGNGVIDASELQAALNAVKWEKDFHDSWAPNEFSPKTMYLLMGEFGVLPYDRWELLLGYVEAQSRRFSPAGPQPFDAFLREQMRYA